MLHCGASVIDSPVVGLIKAGEAGAPEVGHISRGEMDGRREPSPDVQ